MKEPGKGYSECKGPEVDVHLTYVRESEESSPGWEITH